MAQVGDALDAVGRKMLMEDLRSPCTLGDRGISSVRRTSCARRNGFVVLDTAPTGRTLLLLDAAEADNREVLRPSVEASELFKTCWSDCETLSSLGP